MQLNQPTSYQSLLFFLRFFLGFGRQTGVLVVAAAKRSADYLFNRARLQTNKQKISQSFNQESCTVQVYFGKGPNRVFDLVGNNFDTATQMEPNFYFFAQIILDYDVLLLLWRIFVVFALQLVSRKSRNFFLSRKVKFPQLFSEIFREKL